MRVSQVYARDVNFGLISFAFEGEPKLTYKLLNKHGQNTFEPLVWPASDLRNGVCSSDRAIDALSRYRHEQSLSGVDYYAPR